MSTLATKAELKADQDKLVKFQAFDPSYFRGVQVTLKMMALKII